MAHHRQLDKELSQYPRIKKFLKRTRAVDSLRSLSKWIKDTNVPNGHQEYFFSRYCERIYNTVLQSSSELDAAAREMASSSPSMFNSVFKKEKHVKVEDFKPPILVLGKLIWFERAKFRSGWNLASLHSFLICLLNPENRHEFRLLGVDILLVIIDVLRLKQGVGESEGSNAKIAANKISSTENGSGSSSGSESTSSNDGTTPGTTTTTTYEQKFVTLLGQVFNLHSKLWSNKIAILNKWLFTLAPPTINTDGMTTTAAASVAVSATSTTSATTTTSSSSTSTTTTITHLLENANKVLLYAAAPNQSHNELSNDDTDKLLYWYQIVLNTIGSNAFGYNVDDTKKEETTSPTSFAMKNIYVELRFSLIEWIVRHMFEDSFATVALSTHQLSNQLFILFGNMFPSTINNVDWGGNNNDSNSSSSSSSPGSVQILILTWYSSLITRLNRHGILSNLELFNTTYFPLMYTHAGKSISIGGGNNESLVLSGISFFETCSRSWYNNLPKTLWDPFKKIALDSVVVLSSSASITSNRTSTSTTTTTDDFTLSYSFGTRLLLELWLRDPTLDSTKDTWKELQIHGISLLRTNAAVAVWKKFVLGITNSMLTLMYEPRPNNVTNRKNGVDEDCEDDDTDDDTTGSVIAKQQQQQKQIDGSRSTPRNHRNIHSTRNKIHVHERMLTNHSISKIQHFRDLVDSSTASTLTATGTTTTTATAAVTTVPSATSNNNVAETKQSIAQKKTSFAQRPTKTSLYNIRQSVPVIIQRAFLKLNHHNKEDKDSNFKNLHLKKKEHAIRLWYSILRIVTLGNTNNIVSDQFTSVTLRNAIYSTFTSIVDVWCATQSNNTTTTTTTTNAFPVSYHILRTIGSFIYNNGCSDLYTFKWKIKTNNILIDTTISPLHIPGLITSYRALCLILSVRASTSFNSSPSHSTDNLQSKLLIKGYELINVGLGMRSDNDTSTTNIDACIVRTILLHGTNLLGTGHRGVSLLLPSLLGGLQKIHKKKLKIPTRPTRGGAKKIKIKNDVISISERSAAVVLITSMIAQSRCLTAPSLGMWSIHMTHSIVPKIQVDNDKEKEKDEKKNEKKNENENENSENLNSKTLWYHPVPYFLRRFIALELLLYMYENEKDIAIRTQCIHSLALGLHHLLNASQKNDHLKQHEQKMIEILNLRNCLHDRNLRNNLILFCEKEYSSENIEFWLAVESYRELFGSENQNFELLEHARMLKVQSILSMYIGSNAIKEVNIPATIKNALMKQVNDKIYDIDLFNTAQNEIYHLLRKDTMPRYRTHMKTNYTNMSTIILERLFQQIDVTSNSTIDNTTDTNTNNHNNKATGGKEYEPSLAATWSLSTLAGWVNQTIDRSISIPSVLQPVPFILKLSKRITAISNEALLNKNWNANYLLTQLINTLQEWLFLPPMNGISVFDNRQALESVFAALETCLRFGCGNTIVPMDLDEHLEQRNENGKNHKSSFSLIRILRLLKHTPEKFSNTSNAESIRLHSIFYITETLIINLQKSYNIFPMLSGPSNFSSNVKEPFMSKEILSSAVSIAPVASVASDGSVETTSSHLPSLPSTIVFGYHSRIMSLTEMPPNDICKLSRVRIVVRDVTGRYCWDLIPSSADPEGSEALCYHRKMEGVENVANVQGSGDGGDGGKKGEGGDGGGDIDSDIDTTSTVNEIDALDIVVNSIHTDDDNNDNNDNNDNINNLDVEKKIEKETIQNTDPTLELLSFIKNNQNKNESSSLNQFAEFVTKFNPYQQKDGLLSHSSTSTYNAHIKADQVHGLGSSNKNNRKNQNNITIGVPESGCQSVVPTIQPATLTSFDRCRQALAHLGFLSPSMFSELVMFNSSTKEDLLKLQTYFNTLDKMRPRKSYRIGIVHVKSNQNTQYDIMHNTDLTDVEFNHFLNSLGWKVNAKTHSENGGFMSGLDHKLHESMLYYSNACLEIGYHVLNWMPLSLQDRQQIERKKHVGNDTVVIVWCNNSKGYDVNTFISQVTEIFIVLIPIRNESNGKVLIKVQIFSRDSTLMFGPLQDGCLVECSMIGLLVRSTAINAIDATKKSSGGGSGGNGGSGGSGGSANNNQMFLNPSLLRKDRISKILKRLSTEVNQRDVAVNLFA